MSELADRGEALRPTLTDRATVAVREVLAGRRRGVRAVLPVDLRISGCPPEPMRLLEGLVALVEAPAGPGRA